MITDQFLKIGIKKNIYNNKKSVNAQKFCVKNILSIS